MLSSVSHMHTVQNACSVENGGCGQICVTSNDSSDAYCECAEGFFLDSDGKQCIGEVHKERSGGRGSIEGGGEGNQLDVAASQLYGNFGLNLLCIPPSLPPSLPFSSPSLC